MYVGSIVVIVLSIVTYFATTKRHTIEIIVFSFAVIVFICLVIQDIVPLCYRVFGVYADDHEATNNDRDEVVEDQLMEIDNIPLPINVSINNDNRVHSVSKLLDLSSFIEIMGKINVYIEHVNQDD